MLPTNSTPPANPKMVSKPLSTVKVKRSTPTPLPHTTSQSVPIAPVTDPQAVPVPAFMSRQ
jgi:hypothetical protein